MKKLFLTLMLVLSPRLVHAYGAISISSSPISEPVTPVSMSFSSSMTITGITISSQTGQATELTLARESGDMLWRSIAVQNLDANNVIWCSDSPNVCKTAGTSCAGIQISAGSPGALATFTLIPGQRLYCLCNSSTAACNASIARGR